MRRGALSISECLAIITVLATAGCLLGPLFSPPAMMRPTILSNVKQSALGVMMYANDYDDRLPMVAYRIGGNGCLPAPDGAIVQTAYDSLWPYIRSTAPLMNPLMPGAIPLVNRAKPAEGVLSQFGWRCATSIEEVGFAPNFRLFEDTALNSPLGNNNPVFNSDWLRHPEITSLLFTAKFVLRDSSYSDKSLRATTPPDPYADAYARPKTQFSEFNLSAHESPEGRVTLAFADGHAKAVSASNPLQPSTAPDWSTGAMQVIPTYHYPYDMTGIPDIVAEQYRLGVNPRCR